MPSTEILDQPRPEEHFVQLYGRDDRLLTRNVSRYLSEGLRRGEGLLVVATAEHRGTLVRHLTEERGYARAVLEGRLVFLDAETTLNRFLVGGEPIEPQLWQRHSTVPSKSSTRSDHSTSPDRHARHASAAATSDGSSSPRKLASSSDSSIARTVPRLDRPDHCQTR